MKTETNTRSRLFRRTALALGVLLALMLVSLALGSDGLAAPDADDYTISWASVDGGGAARGSRGSYTLSGSVGQPDAGNHSPGDGYRVHSGFMVAFTTELYRYYLPLVVRDHTATLDRSR
ncbi:MAG: hypothetical protein ACK2US_12635 [Anaerolineae bacterium]|jgi:hypothetical protein